MPIYEYECRLCHHRFERRQSFGEKPEAACPKCQGQSQRVIQPVPIFYKGSGFYVTDHGRGSPGSRGSEKEGEKEKKEEVKKEEVKTEAS